MLTLHDDGTASIDFPDGKVTIRPPTFGGLKRLRAQRVKVARDAEDALAAWDEAHTLPDDADALTTCHHDEDRLIAVQDANHEAAAAWWRLVLLGDESFKRLSEGPVPDDVDDWPAGLLFDVRPIIRPNPDGTFSTEQVLAAQSLPDALMRHFGLGRSRSSSGNPNGQVTNPSALAL